MELSILVFLPALVAVAILLLPAHQEHRARYLALGGSLVTLVYSVVLFFDFEIGREGYQFVERREWVDIGAFNLQYALGVDGLSMPLLVLTTFLTTASVLVSFSIRER